MRTGAVRERERDVLPQQLLLIPEYSKAIVSVETLKQEEKEDSTEQNKAAKRKHHQKTKARRKAMPGFYCGTNKGIINIIHILRTIKLSNVSN